MATIYLGGAIGGTIAGAMSSMILPEADYGVLVRIAAR